MAPLGGTIDLEGWWRHFNRCILFYGVEAFCYEVVDTVFVHQVIVLRLQGLPPLGTGSIREDHGLA